MTIFEPIDGDNHSNNLICPQCHTSLPAYTIFCSVCGRRIKGDKEGEAYAENYHDDAIVDTAYVPSLQKTYRKSLQLDQSLKDDEIIRQTHKSKLRPLDVEAPISEQLTAPSLPVPDIDTTKQDAISPSQHWKQQTTKPHSKVHTSHRPSGGMLGSNSGFTKRNSTPVEDTKDAIDMKLINAETSKLSMPSNNNSVVTESLSKTWGWLPILSLTSAIGVYLLALTYEAGRLSSHWSDILFWLSLLVLYLPIAMRLFLARSSRQERIALLIVLTVGFYFVQYLQYPLYFTSYDELIHVRTAQDILASGHLFHTNPLLPINSFYPGLEIATDALSSLTGLSLFASGIVLIGSTRLLLVLSLYLFFEYLSKSSRIAAIATLIYMMNSGFVFFDEMFAYESLAISLALFVVFAIAYRCYMYAGHHKGLTLAIWLALGAIVIIHHVTSYALVLFLLLWTVIAFVRKLTKKDQIGPGGVAFLGLALCIVWLLYTGNAVVDYLAPHFTDTLAQLQQILVGQSAPRQLFHSSSNSPTFPLWERLASYSSIALIGVGLLFGMFQVWRYHRTNTAILVLTSIAFVYPFSQVLRFTSTGAEMASRSTEFLFVGVAFILSIGAVSFWLFRIPPDWKRSVIMIGAVIIIFVGQAILGSGPPWTRIPGPYLVSADDHSIEPESIDAAKWANLYLGPEHRIATDRDNALLMATYGQQWVVTATNAPIGVSSLFTLLQLGPNMRLILLEDKISYLVVDLRLSTGLPTVGTYFNGGESDANHYTNPIDPAALTKFDGVKNVDRLFDSGNIVIYNVDGLVNGPSTAPAPPACITTPSTAGSSSYPSVAKTYTGALYDISTGLTTSISLTGIQQQHGAICGSFGGIPAGSFKGTVTTAGRIQFTITSSAEQSNTSFTGTLLSDGSMIGTYCALGVNAGTCSDYGLWSVSPAKSG